MQPDKTTCRRKLENGHLRWVVEFPYGKGIFHRFDDALSFAVRITK